MKGEKGKKKKLGILAVSVMLLFAACGNKAGIDEVAKSGDVDMSWTEKKNEETDPSFERPEPGEISIKTPDSKLDEKERNNPRFSAESGFYKDGFTLELYCADENAEIFYTLDGSEPDENSSFYDGGIIITDRSREANLLSTIRGVNPSGDYIPQDSVLKGTVVRAVAKLSDGSMSGISNGTFFVGIDRKQKFGDTPVISLITDSDNLFDYETGIYVMGKTNADWLAEDPANKFKDGWQQKGNYSNKGKEWEKPAAIVMIPSASSYLDEEGVSALAGFDIDVGIRIMGAASRSNMQKSFRVRCREEYGDKNIKYALIPANDRADGCGVVEKYKSFLIRNGGNDCDYAKFRDSFLQNLVSNRSFDTQAATPMVLFIDGEYWGAYVLTEDYSDNYVENNYGIEDDNVVIVKRWEIEAGLEEDIALFSEMYDYITENDMSDNENYEMASELLDMKSYSEYCAFMVYINNEDSIFKGNNWQMWRARTTDPENPYADGKWRVMAYDTEYSTGIYDDKNYREDSLKKAIDGNNKNIGTQLLHALIKNEDFKTMFINDLCDMRNIDFEENRMADMLTDYERAYEKIVPDTIKRFGPDWVVRWNEPGSYFHERVSGIRSWLKARYRIFHEQISRNFALENAVTVNIVSSDYTKGGFRLNNSGLTFGSDYSGKYFAEPGFTVSCSADSNSFDHWEVENGTVSDPKAETTRIYPKEGCFVTAVYN